MKKKEPIASDVNTDFAWRVHDNITQGTGRADTKASIALAIEVAVLGFMISFGEAEKKGPFADLHDWRMVVHTISIVVLCISIVMSLLAVIPQLRRRSTKKEYRSNMIYFGHLRLWNPAELGKALSSEVPESSQLARQLVHMSKISWTKHVFLQWSLAAFVTSGILDSIILIFC